MASESTELAPLLDGTDAEGDCFEVAGRLVRKHRDWVLCHGIVHGQGKLEGYRFWHAWCECRLEGTDVWIAVDRSNGHNVETLAVTYYRVGKIDPDQVYRFSADDAAILMLQLGNWGPWDINEEVSDGAA